ncbi:MAG: hypothetical protein V4475_13150 [Pseudomonadota bacterium]
MARRRNLCSQASRLTLRSVIAAATVAGVSLLAPGQAWAQCLVGGTTVTCDTTTTTNTTFPANAPNDRNYQGLLPVPVVVTVNPGATVSGNGIAVSNAGTGGVTVTNNGAISVDAGNTPTAGGTAALSVSAAGGAITYTGGSITNNGNGNAFDAVQTGGVGSVNINVTGNVSAAAGEGITVRDVATSTGISVTTNAVTALTAGKDGIDAQSQSLTGNITEVANGNIQAGNAGMVAAILNAAGTGNIDVTANGSIDARFGIDAENFGAGSTSVTTVGPVNVTTGNGIFALSTGGNVTVNAGDVTAVSNTAIIAQQTKVAGAGAVSVTTGNVSGTTGIDAHNFGTGTIDITTHGTVTGTAAEGIKANGNGAVTVTVDQAVTGATRGLSLIGGTGGSGNISVTGTGGFNGGTGDAANILNNGSGTVTVNISGASSSAGGEGFVVRDTAAGGNISITTGAVTALTAGKDAIDVQSQSLTGNITEVANGNIQAGNAGMVAAILNAAGTGNIDVTANGSIDARFGIDAENFGSGSTSVTTVGPVNVTTGNGIFALTTGGNVTVNAGDVTSTGNTAIIAQQTKVAGAGTVSVTAGNVSGTTGIDAHNFGTGTIDVTTHGTVTGTFAEGIKATGNGAVTVTVDQAVTGATRGLSLIGGTGGGGNISVTGTGGFNGGSGDAANILNNGSGTVTVNVSGASSSTGGEGFVVRDTAAGGNISVTTGAVTALTAGKDAIDVQSQSATGNITEVVNGNLQAGNAAMVAAILNAAGTGNIDVTANGSIDARFGIDAENFGSGSTSVTTVGPVNVTTGNGIFALTTGGNVTVNAGDVTSTGNTAIIAQQTKVAGAGAVSVTAGNVSGTTGIDAHNFGTGTVDITTHGTVTGTFAEGIKVNGNGAVTVTVDQAVTGATRGLSLIGGTGGSGNISVTGTGGFNGGSGDAANILNNGSGTVTVNVSGASSSTAGNGFIVRDTALGGNISVTTGAVTALTAGKNGIDVQTQSATANVTEVANGNIQAGNAGMVAAIFPAAATGNIDVTANGSIDARFGIDAENFGTGSTSVTTVGPVNVTSGNGIFALTNGGNVTVHAGDVNSTGNIAIIAQQTNAAGAGAIDVTGGRVTGTTGIVATNLGTGAITVTTGSGGVIGTNAEGMLLQGNGAVTVSVADTVAGATRGLSLVGGTGGTGNISVTGVGSFVGGSGDGANILNNGAGTVTVNTSGQFISTAGNGLIVRDTALGGNISVTTGAVTALAPGKNGIDVQSQSLTANITEVVNGNIQAGNAGMVAAIFPAAATGNIDVTANGSLTARFGVDAENFGTGSTSVKTVGPVNVTTGNGIFALTTGGAVTVTAGNVTSTGNTAIIAQQTNAAGAGAVSVTAGNVSGTTGIVATNFGTGTLGVTTHGTVTGTAAEGIKATGNAGVTVAVDAAVTGATRGLSLVGGTGGTGNISVTGTGGFVGGTGDGANILNNGAGTTTVNISGASGSTAGNGIIVRDTALGGNISVTTGAVTALAAGKNAVDVQSVSATANVTEVANGNIQAGNAGMVAAIFPAAATGNINVTANGTINARFGVDAENFGTGNTIVHTVGPVNATTGNGIFALSAGGNVVVNAGDVTSVGNTAIIARRTNAGGPGAVGVIAGNVSGTTGIDASNVSFAGLTITANGTVTGTAAEGIKAVGNNVVVTTTGAVTGATRGLSLVNGTGFVLVMGTGGFVGGSDDAANILNNGAGTTTYNISGATSSTGGNGIVIRDSAIGGNIDVTTGAVTALAAGKNAIDVVSLSNTANVTVVTNGNVQAGNAGVVAALVSPTATGNVDVTANGAIDARFGVDAENFGAGTTTVKTVAPVTATTGNGLFALSTGGNVKVTAASVSSTGNTAIVAQQVLAGGAGTVDAALGGAVTGTTGINASNAGTGSVRISGAGSVTGTTGTAIVATSASGNIDILSTGIIVGATNGITATSTSGTVTISGTGAVTASNGTGIYGFSNAGNVVIAPASFVTATGGSGILGQVAGGGNVNITTVGKATSTTGIGIAAITNNGGATVTANGQVAGVTAGIYGTATGSGSVVINGNANIAASNGTGILATLQGAGAGTITVNQGVNSLITATGGHGIQTDSGTSTGLTTINVAGEVRATGAGNAGIRGISTAGGITVNIATTGKVDPDFGIALNTVNGALVVNNSGLVTGNITGVQLVATGTGTATINNAGTITGGTNAVVGSLNGGAFTLLNLGVLNGAINVGGSSIAGSTWTNAAGSIANLTGASVFSGNLVNTGTTNIGAGATLGILGNSANAGRINFIGAGTFTTNGALANTGIINAQNNLTTNVVTVGGNYTGGGQFFVDYSTVTATADRMNIGGTASGNTNVTLNRVGTRSFVPGGFLPVVTVVPGAPVGTFTSNTVFDTTGFVLDSFGRNPASATQFGLIQTINPLAMPLGDLSYMAEAASANLDEPISPFVTMRNDPPASATRFSLWVRGGGGHTTETVDSRLVGGGVTYTGSSDMRTVHESAQFGADIGFLNLGGHGWNVNVGLTGGWYDGQVALTSVDRMKVETPFVGGYVVVGNGAATLEGSIRREWRHYKLAMPTLFGAIGTQKLDGSATAYSLRGSYRIGGQTGFAATPFASFHYADSRIDPLTIDALSVWTPGSDKTKIGQAGLRLSYRGNVGSSFTLEPFASAARLENWSSGDSSSFAFGTPVTTFSLDTVSWKHAMRYSLGLIGTGAGGRVSGFVVGNINDDARLRSFTINAGLRFNF